MMEDGRRGSVREEGRGEEKRTGREKGNPVVAPRVKVLPGLRDSAPPEDSPGWKDMTDFHNFVDVCAHTH